MLQAEFSANAEKAARVQAKTPVIHGNSEWHSPCTRSSLTLERNERDPKDRERFEWTEDNDTADWPHAARAYCRIESANKGRRGERHARLERSQPGRFGCHSLPRKMSNRRHLPRPLFSLHKQLDRQREVQRPIKFAENSTRNQAN
jgi:hypothetical protein